MVMEEGGVIRPLTIKIISDIPARPIVATLDPDSILQCPLKRSITAVLNFGLLKRAMRHAVRQQA